MIYIYRHSQNKKDKEAGQIMSFSNHYGRYDDILGKIKNEDLFDDIPCVVDYINKMIEKKFSKVARLVDEHGTAVIQKNNVPRYLVICALAYINSSISLHHI